MSWFGKAGKKTSSTRKRTSSKKKASRSKTSSSKRSSRVCFVNGKPKTAVPKQEGSGYYYSRRLASGKVQKMSVTGKTYTKTQALSRIRKASK